MNGSQDENFEGCFPGSDATKNPDHDVLFPTVEGLDVEYYLVNVDYGAFLLSSACMDVLEQRPGWCDGDEWGEEFRGDPQLIKLFKEKGAKWIGGSLRSQIVPVAYPAGFEDFVRISEYDGLETLRVDFSRAFEKGVKDLMAQEDATMEDVRALDSKIAKTRELYWTLVHSLPSRRGYA